MIHLPNVPLVLAAALCSFAAPAGTPTGQIKPETARDFDCYIQTAEARMEARTVFIAAVPDNGQELVLGRKILTVAPSGANPHKVAAGQLYDWVGTVFIPGGNLDRLVLMLQDYDHRAEYFPETISSSKLLCRTGKDHFRYTMRMKEPAVLDVESDVTWEHVDAHRWRCRSYATSVHEVGKDHGYLRRLNSYWRFEEASGGVFVEGETITLSDEFGGVARAFGSAFLQINPEKSLRHSLQSMRESILKPGLRIANPPEGVAECGEAFHPAPCNAAK
ncbi:MAG TPA: hypothetical protein VLY24_06155 [Bryobacteraceae bacterium]|nr:hypothetical protein [Bryobacteraceae bacterium]